MQSIVGSCLAGFIAAAFASSVANAQSGSVKAVFEKQGLLGTFARDCSKPASKDNGYYIHRLLDASRVQRDYMDSPTNRLWFVILDQARETSPNEILVTGTMDGKPVTSTYRVEAGRMLVVDSTLDGRPVVTAGRSPAGVVLPWVSRCAPPR